MSEKITLNKIEQNLNFFRKMYDVVRLVDPIQKCVLEYNECTMGKTDSICHNYWENGKICDNCISVRAHHDNKSFMKLEYKPGAIMMVTAIPLETDKFPVVLELLKNATENMMVGTFDYNNGHLLHDMALNFNDMVTKDKLTHLYNRRFIDDRLPVDIVNSTITDTPLSVIFLDVDDLKIINDEYGHSVGDLAIKEVGHAIKNSIRVDKDWAARYGGDEFIICLNNTTYNEALHISERIRSNVGKIYVSTLNENINLSISLGIHTAHGLNLTAEDIINIADERMYEAKIKRKNSTVED